MKFKQIFSHCKQAEASLRCQALTFENMHDGVIITDLTGNIVDCNPAAGMDDYISKPVRFQELAQALSKCPRQRSLEVSFTVKQDKVMCLELEPSQNILQEGQNQTLKSAKILQSLRDIVRGDRVVFAELIGCYLTETPKLVQDISTAIATHDAETLWKAAHQLKSSSASIGAIALAQVCKVLEAQGRSSELDNSVELLTQLYEEYQQVKTALEKELVEGTP